MPSRTLSPTPPGASGPYIPLEPSPPRPAAAAPGQAAAGAPGPTAGVAPRPEPAAGVAARSVAPGATVPTAAGPTAPESATAWSGLRLVRVPAGWPPYDCEIHGTACPAATANSRTVSQTADPAEPLADSAASSEPAPQTASPSAPGQEPTSSAAATADAPAMFGVPVGLGSSPAQTSSPGRGTAWPARFAQAIVEVLAGSRSPRQLVPWTTEPVRAQINLISQALFSGERPRIRRIMTSQPAARVVEMTVVVSFGPRSRALAMRFEHEPARRPAPGRPGRPERWLCTEIETG